MCAAGLTRGQVALVQIPRPRVRELMQGYVEQSKKMFDTMQEQMARQTEQMLGAFGIKR